MQGAYSDVEGHLPQSLEAWRASGIDAPGWDPALWIVAHDAKGIVGAALGEKDKRHRRGRRTWPSRTAPAGAATRARCCSCCCRPSAPSGCGTPRPPSMARPPRPRALFESVGMAPARQSERWEKSLAV